MEHATLELTPILELRVEALSPLTAGPTPRGEVRLVPFAGGSFHGPDLEGTLLPGGADWQTVRADGVVEIRAHYLLETVQGEGIEVVSEGLRHGAPGVLERIAAGEVVSPEEYYFRTHIRLHTGSARLDHLNRLLAVSTGRRTVDAVELTIFRVP